MALPRLPPFQARLHGLPTRAGFSAFFRATEHIRLTQEITGYFRTGAFYEAVATAHREMAELVQDKAVENLQRAVRSNGRPQLEDYPRPGRQGKRLEMSILAEDNRFVSASGFLVGRDSWLRRSPAALYYRLIEEGGQSYYTSGLFFHPDVLRVGVRRTGGSTAAGGMRGLRPATGSKGAIKLSQRPMPFTFQVSGTPAYHMMRDAGRWWSTQHDEMYTLYDRRLRAVGFSVPLRRSG